MRYLSTFFYIFLHDYALKQTTYQCLVASQKKLIKSINSNSQNIKAFFIAIFAKIFSASCIAKQNDKILYRHSFITLASNMTRLSINEAKENIILTLNDISKLKL